jgi:hypothetical protein
MTNADTLLQLASAYENRCIQGLVKVAKIRKLPDGRYRVLSQKGKDLGTYRSQKGAEKRLRQVEFFKHLDKSKADDLGNPVKPIDLTGADEFSYSALMRKLRQEASPEQVKEFLKLFKVQFDRAVKNKIHKPEKIALQNAIIKFHKIHPVKLDKKMVKCAAVAELGNAESVGKYLSDIVKFILARLPMEKRPHAAEILKQKFAVMSENEIAGKNMPNAAVYGQAITFVKHVLFNQDANYIRDVLNSLSRNL